MMSLSQQPYKLYAVKRLDKQQFLDIMEFSHFKISYTHVLYVEC